jgi:serine protease
MRVSRVSIALISLVSLLSVISYAEDFQVGQACTGSTTDRYAPDEIIVKFKNDATRQQAYKALADFGTVEISSNESLGFRELRIPAGKTVEEMVAAFSARPDVEYAEPNYIAHAFMTPNDPYYSYQWHMPLIKMPQAWDQSTGTGVIVAVIDCGVAYENYGVYYQAPDLAGTSFVPGYDFVNNDSHPDDDCAHGTHVAGTIAQTTNNNLGVTGVAFNCSIMPVKVLNASGSGTYTQIANGITFAADHGAQVINMSLGGSSSSSTLQNAVIYAYNKGIAIVCAAGNAGTSTPQYPAAYTQCISVSAVRYDKTYPSYSSYGSTIDICAPGGDVTVDQNGDGYGDGVLQQTHDGTHYGTFGYYFYDGTSMASPHVAGVAALLIAKNGGSMSPDAVRAAIQNTAEDLGPAGWDQHYGYGLVDANAALLSIGGAAPVANFSGTPTSGTAPLTVAFTDLSTNGPTSWAWTFGDGGTSTAQNPSHTYTSAGTYTVTLTATNSYGSDGETKTGYISVSNPPTNPPVANFSGTPTSGTAPLTVAFTDLSTNTPTSWSWTFGDGGTSTAQNPSHTYTSAGTYTVTLTATNSYGSDGETKTDYITVTSTPTWTVITFDNFESGMGSYTDGGGDMSRYRSTTYAHQGSYSADIQDNSGTASSFYHTNGYNVSGYSEMEVDFWFRAVSMENGEDFWVQYYNGSAWVTVKSFIAGTDFSNNTFYHVVVPISRSSYNFPTNAKLRFMCDASDNNDDVYIDEIEWRGSGGSGSSNSGEIAGMLPDGFSLNQNYPNPFNPITTIRFGLPTAMHITLEVYNILGQRVTVLTDEYMEAGDHQVTWDASTYSSGVYLYRLAAGGYVQTHKMILIK